MTPFPRSGKSNFSADVEDLFSGDSGFGSCCVSSSVAAFFSISLRVTKTVDLDVIRQPHLLQRPSESCSLIPGDQNVQHVENGAHPISRNWFFQKKLRTAGQAVTALCFTPPSR